MIGRTRRGEIRVIGMLPVSPGLLYDPGHTSLTFPGCVSCLVFRLNRTSALDRLLYEMVIIPGGTCSRRGTVWRESGQDTRVHVRRFVATEQGLEYHQRSPARTAFKKEEGKGGLAAMKRVRSNPVEQRSTVAAGRIDPTPQPVARRHRGIRRPAVRSRTPASGRGQNPGPAPSQR
mgnify:CR=1 FL=1